MTVSVPATSANLGPGFDCFGLALSWAESVRLEVIASGYDIDVSGEGADLLPRDESHLIIRSALTGFADLGISVPGLRLSCRNTIPHGRGLGSSSAAIVAGLLAARSLAAEPPDRHWLLQHANAIEGHPDNVAAAIYGGFVLAYGGSDGVAVAQGRLAPDLGAVVFVPDTPVATHAARGLLPEVVPHEDAAANSGRAALLVHALAADLDLLHDATREWLHQDYRSRAMPESFRLLSTLRGRGLAAVISGAGPTVIVLGRRAVMDALAGEDQPGFAATRAFVGSGAAVTAESVEPPRR
ncbi:MAG TPA: homoserine kinase [Propionibacteriaceae bacterium]|nr:homoserine kinase [Propionibacteriaceae bacterium]